MRKTSDKATGRGRRRLWGGGGAGTPSRALGGREEAGGLLRKAFLPGGRDTSKGHVSVWAGYHPGGPWRAVTRQHSSRPRTVSRMALFPSHPEPVHPGTPCPTPVHRPALEKPSRWGLPSASPRWAPACSCTIRGVGEQLETQRLARPSP